MTTLDALTTALEMLDTIAHGESIPVRIYHRNLIRIRAVAGIEMIEHAQSHLVEATDDWHEGYQATVDELRAAQSRLTRDLDLMEHV